MTRPNRARDLPSAALSALLLAALVAGCDGGGEPGPEEPAQASQTSAGGGDASAAAGEARRTGTITIGEQTWTVEPTIQCSVYPGDVVSIAGHAADDPDIEIVLDHDPASNLVQARVQGGDINWQAGSEDVTFEIDGDTVSGTGTFRVGPGVLVPEGQPREAEGSFTVTC